MARLKDQYYQEIIPQLMKTLGKSNKYAVPRILSITLNMGDGEFSRNSKALDGALADLEAIAGQKPLIRRARKAIASFKIREKWPVGIKVTLRRSRMYEFLDRLITIVIPRIRDFQGLKAQSFDGSGNYNFGIKEYIAFPEIDYDKINSIRGLDINIVTSAKDDKSAIALLSAFGFPLITGAK